MLAALRVFAIVAALLVYYPLHAMTSRSGRRWAWAGRYERLVGRIVGLRIRVVGTPLARHVLLVANHVSWVDILAIGGVTGATFIAKSEIAGWPLIGNLARVGGTVFVERDRRGAVLAQADSVGLALDTGRPVTLFAEGTTGNGIAPLPFRASLFAAAAGRRDIRVQPLALRYADPAAQWWPPNEPAGHNAWRLLNRLRPKHLTMIFLDPIDPAGLDRKALAARCEAAVAAALRS